MDQQGHRWRGLIKKKKLFWETVKIPQKNKINKLKNFETGIKEKTPSLSH